MSGCTTLQQTPGKLLRYPGTQALSLKSKPGKPQVESHSVEAFGLCGADILKSRSGQAVRKTGVKLI